MKQKTMQDYLKKLKIKIVYCPKCHEFGELWDCFNLPRYYCGNCKKKSVMKVLLTRKPTQSESKGFLKSSTPEKMVKMKEMIDKKYLNTN